MKKFIDLLFILIACGMLIIIGCGGSDSDDSSDSTFNDVVIDGVPRIETTVQNSCVSRAITQLLQQKKVSVTFEDVLDRVGLPPFEHDGYYGVRDWVRRFGYEMKYSTQGTKQDIINLLSNGVLVMVSQMYSYEDWQGHNRVVMGYNLDDQVFILEDDGLPPRYRMHMDVFMDLWIRGSNELGWPGPPFWYLLPI